MSKKVIVLLAEGFEEVEAVTPIDYLRRAGIEVTVAAVGSKTSGKPPVIKGSHDIQIAADTDIHSLIEGKKLVPAGWDGVVVPGGGPGSDNLAASKEVGTFLRAMADAGKLVSAICAAPARVLSPLGLLTGKKFTCFPGEEEKVTASGSTSTVAGGIAVWKKDRVVVDGNLITSRGAGTAGEFACAIVSKLLGEADGKKLAERVLLNQKV